VDRNDNVYVGDRANRRIQVFDTEGKFLRMFTIDLPPAPGIRPVNGNTPTGDRLAATIGAPNSICITPGQNQVMFVGESTFPGRIFKVTLEGKVLGVIGRSGRQLKQFSGADQLAPRRRTGGCRSWSSHRRPARPRRGGDPGPLAKGYKLRATGRTMAESPIVCTLLPDELRERREGLLAELSRRVLGREDRGDGVRLEFASDPDTLALIASVVDAERQCCRFLRFSIQVESDDGPIYLDLTGPPGTREFLAGMLGE
jgi:hypothetical protein